MELMQLEMFVAIVEERSFLGAAERVFRTQPAVSIGLRKLEDKIGAPLLDRSQRRSTRLTVIDSADASWCLVASPLFNIARGRPHSYQQT